MKLGEAKGSYYIYLPKQIVEKILKWKKGDELDYEIIEKDGEIGLFIYKKD